MTITSLQPVADEWPQQLRMQQQAFRSASYDFEFPHLLPAALCNGSLRVASCCPVDADCSCRDAYYFCCPKSIRDLVVLLTGSIVAFVAGALHGLQAAFCTSISNGSSGYHAAHHLFGLPDIPDMVLQAFISIMDQVPSSIWKGEERLAF